MHIFRIVYLKLNVGKRSSVATTTASAQSAIHFNVLCMRVSFFSFPFSILSFVFLFHSLSYYRRRNSKQFSSLYFSFSLLFVRFVTACVGCALSISFHSFQASFDFSFSICFVALLSLVHSFRFFFFSFSGLFSLFISRMWCTHTLHSYHSIRTFNGNSKKKKEEKQREREKNENWKYGTRREKYQRPARHAERQGHSSNMK